MKEEGIHVHSMVSSISCVRSIYLIYQKLILFSHSIAIFFKIFQFFLAALYWNHWHKDGRPKRHNHIRGIQKTQIIRRRLHNERWTFAWNRYAMAHHSQRPRPHGLDRTTRLFFRLCKRYLPSIAVEICPEFRGLTSFGAFYGISDLKPLSS